MKIENKKLYSPVEVDKLIKELKFEQIRTEKYFNVAGITLMVLDKNAEIIMINNKGCELLEGSKKEIIGKNWFETFLPKNNIDKIQQVFNDVISGDSEFVSTFQNEIVTLSGKRKTVSWHNTILKDINGQIKEVLSSGIDITEQMKSKEALLESNRRLQTLFENAPLGYQSLDINGNLREINQTWAQLLGYDKEEVIGKWFGDFLTPKYQENFKKRFEIFKKRGRIHSEFEMIHKDGSIKYIEFEGMIGYDDNRNFIQTYCNLNDITERHKVQMRIKENEENLRLAQNIAQIGSWELDINKNCLNLSDEALKIFEITGKNKCYNLNDFSNIIDVQDREYFKQTLNNLIHENTPFDTTFKVHTSNGNIKYINSKATVFSDSNDIPIKVIGVIRDITVERNRQMKLEYINIHDYLTNLYNRRYYFEQFKFLDQEAYYPLGIMMMDVNGLKIINDAFGHSVGDVALKTIGNILKEVFGPNDIISRIGGDEFAALLPNTNPATLQKYKEKIISSIRANHIQNIELSLAVGYEIKMNVIEDIDELQRLAENRMYKHKTTVASSIRSKAINAILETLTSKYEDEKNHSYKVSKLCKEIGRAMDLKGDELNELEQAGLFHDIGKISIPDDILKKPGKLTDEEFDVLKSHTEVGYQILRAADEYSDLAIYALHHHEKWDGTGYPKKLKGNNIPLYARIITVVDAFEAMTADRPYRKKLSIEYAVSEIKRCSGSQFDPKIAKIFVEKVLNQPWN